MRRRTFLETSSLSLIGAAMAPSLAAAAAASSHGSADLVVAAGSRATGPILVRGGEDRFGEDVRLGGVSPNRLKVSAVDTAGALAVFEFESVGKGGPSLHVHHDQDEWFFVREGQYVFRVGDAELRLGPGDSLLGPRGIPHTWAHLESGTGRLLYLVQPAGLMESFFRESAAFHRRRTDEENRRFHEAHGMTWLGPGLVVP
jgi:mannose-6-phosphate isomerase-like protein (cupin superfamily)